MAKQERNQTRGTWLSLAKEAAVEMDQNDRDFAKAEQKLLSSLELLAADETYPNEQRYIDECLIISTLAFAYAGQQRFALACKIADHVSVKVCQKWPAYADADLAMWRAILHKMEQLYLLCGQDDKALDLAVERLDKINELAGLLMDEPTEFPGCEDWIADVVPQAENAILRIRIQGIQAQETFDHVTSLLLAS